MAEGDLTSTDAVTAALLRPLTSDEATFVPGVIVDVSAQLRNRFRAIDARIAAYAADPSDPAGIDPAAVAGMLARVIKRALVNPRGLWSATDSQGPFARSETYPGARGGEGAGATVGAVVTDDDIAQILPKVFAKGGTIRTRPRSAPAPWAECP